MKLSRLARGLATTGVGLGLVTLGGCTSDAEGAAGAYDEVVIAVPEWPGAEANAAVVARVLEEELDVEVQLESLDPSRAWDALDDGSAHAVLEDWGAVPEKLELYREAKRSVVDAGALGITGHVGWYVPRHFADRHPEVLDWRNLNDFTDAFRTPRSGELGQLLQADPDFATRDEQLVERLELAYRPVPAGSEGALLNAISDADRNGTPLLAYWWEPHWLNDRVDMVEVELPEYAEGCAAGREEPACGYPEVELRKYLNAEFAEDGGAAADFLRGFAWSAEEQNEVAALIAGEGMSPDAAAEQWLAENPEAVDGWLGDRDAADDGK